ncbi:MAG: alpha/beta hydrolase [Acidimicrobiia bacterium]
MPLDPQAQVVIDLIESLGFGTVTDATDPIELRHLMDAAAVQSTVVVETVEDREAPGPHGPVPVRVYRPAGADPKPLLVYYHGGGWVLGSLATHDDICRRLATAVDAVVVSVDYRMAPEHLFPAAVDDSFAALTWAHAHAAELGADPDRLVVAGDSAGGNLGAVVSQLARSAGPAISFQLLVYPVTDFEFTSVSMNENAEGYYLSRDMMRWFYGRYLNDPTEGADPRVSPLRATDLGGLPPAFVITAQYDPLRDQGIAYAEALRAAGNDVAMTMYEGLFHGFFGMLADIDAAKVAFDDAVAAVRAAIA